MIQSIIGMRRKGKLRNDCDGVDAVSNKFVEFFQLIDLMEAILLLYHSWLDFSESAIIGQWTLWHSFQPFHRHISAIAII